MTYPVPVARRDSNLGSTRSRTPDQVEALRAAHSRGASPKELAAAQDVSVRTIYRWLTQATETYIVDVDGWRACFEIREGQSPVRVSPWQRR